MGMNKFWEKFEEGANRTRDIPNQIKWAFQRATRGFDDRDIWDLDAAITRFVYPRLEYFRTWQSEHGHSCPGGLDPASWLEVMNKMALAFELLNDRYTGEEERPPDPQNKDAWDTWVKHTQENDAKIKEGLALFGKYLQDLWD